MFSGVVAGGGDRALASNYGPKAVGRVLVSIRATSQQFGFSRLLEALLHFNLSNNRVNHRPCMSGSVWYLDNIAVTHIRSILCTVDASHGVELAVRAEQMGEIEQGNIVDKGSSIERSVPNRSLN